MATNRTMTAKSAINAMAGLPAAAVSMIAIFGASAFAQPTSEGSAAGQADSRSTGALDVVVVTAQRRSESAQGAALALSVLSGESLQTSGLSAPDDLTLLVPGLQVSGGTTTQIYMRGIGDFGATAVANPAVVTSVDGVVVGRPQAISGNFFDIDRIEVLKGPQGTLYGRNASGGAVNVLTVRPELQSLGGYLHGTVGNFDSYAVEGALNLPVGGLSALRVSGQLTKRDGYLTDGSDDADQEAVRVQGRFEPNDRLTVLGSFAFTQLGGEGTGMTRIPSLPGFSAWSGNTAGDMGDAYIAAAAQNFANSGGASIPPFFLTNPEDFQLFQDVESSAASVELTYEFGASTLTVIPAWRETTARFAINPSFLYNVGGAYNDQGDRSKGEETEQYSVEARLAGETDDLIWVVGAYYFDEDQLTDYAIQAGLPLNIRTVTAFTTEAYAAFGQLTYKVTDAVRVTGGLRYTEDERSASDFERYAISPMILGPAPSPADCTPDNGAGIGQLCPVFNPTPGFYDSSKSFEELTWKVGVEIDITPANLLYANVSRGFKAGGYNQAVSYEDPGELMPFEPEAVVAYSIGSKNRFLDNRLQLNAEAFYYDYQDMQISAAGFDGDRQLQLLTRNAGGAEIQGLSVDVVALPWRNGTIRGAVEYLDTEYSDFRIVQPAMFVPPGRVGCPVSAPDASGNVSVDCSGFPLIRAPEWSATDRRCQPDIRSDTRWKRLAGRQSRLREPSVDRRRLSPGSAGAGLRRDVRVGNVHVAGRQVVRQIVDSQHHGRRSLYRRRWNSFPVRHRLGGEFDCPTAHVRPVSRSEVLTHSCHIRVGRHGPRRTLWLPDYCRKLNGTGSRDQQGLPLD